MSIHATERATNVRARLNTYLSGLSLTDSPTVLFERQQRQGDAEGAFVRYTLEWLPGERSGHISASATATREAVQIVADLYWPEGTGYAIDKAADDLVYALSLLSLGFRDYSADPDNPSTVSGYPLRVLDPPRRTRIPASDQYERLRVTAVVRWFTSHS